MKCCSLRVWLAALLTVPLAGIAVEVDGIAAKVGSESILKSDVIREMRRTGRAAAQYEQVRDEMIDRKLILKAAAESKMTMQEWVVESRVRDIIDKGFGGDRNKLLDALSKDRISYPEWYAQIKADLIVSAMRWQVIDKNVSASPAAVRKEFADHPERYFVKGKVTVSVIMLKPEDVGKRKEIDEGLRTKDFEALGARKYVDIEPAEVFNPEICAEIVKMPKGTISHWIEMDGWSFLLRKDDEKGGKARTFEEAFDDVEAAVKEETAKKAYVNWLERLRAETYVKVF